jgi:hypothetical protein
LLLFDNNPAGYARLQFQNASGTKYWQVIGYIDTGVDGNSRLNFYHSINGDLVSFTGDGKVGIGVANPLSKLHIFEGSAGGAIPYSEARLTVEDNDHVYMNFLTPDNKESGILFGLNSNSVHGAILYNSSTPNGLQFRTNGNVPRMVVDQNGRVGIGTTTPTQPLDVVGIVKANNYTYALPKTHYVSIPAAAFSQRQSTDMIIKESGIGGVYLATGGQFGITAPVQLPQSATITAVTLYYTDNSIADNVQFFVQRRFHGAGTSDILCGFESSGTPGATSILLDNVILSVVNNLNYSYFINVNAAPGVWPDSAITINAVVIAYTVTEPQ